MPKFAAKFERVVKTYETCHRIIEAETFERAAELAARLADDFNRECPDDAEEVQGSADFDDWISEIEQTDDEIEADYRDDDEA